MSTKTLILTLTAIVGLPLIACSKEPEDKALEGPIRREFMSASPMDTFIHHGRISWINEEFEFGECDTNELHLIDTSLSMHDTLDQLIQSRIATKM